ncbi:MAG: hypothetical protein LBC43_04515 [Bifidobacteriaceae bacterium]|jgi:hypothetical protein|nr:hypothetical protein [Bifidobacteriaceae bacterium]
MSALPAVSRRPERVVHEGYETKAIQLKKVKLAPKSNRAGKAGFAVILVFSFTLIAQVFLSTLNNQMSYVNEEIEGQIALINQDLQQVNLNIAQKRSSLDKLVKKYGLLYPKDYKVVDLSK